MEFVKSVGISVGSKSNVREKINVRGKINNFILRVEEMSKHENNTVQFLALYFRCIIGAAKGMLSLIKVICRWETLIVITGFYLFMPNFILQVMNALLNMF